MKKIFSILSSLLILFAVTSCKQDYPATGEAQPDPTVTIAEQTLTLAYDNSDQQSIAIAAEVGVEWRVESSEEWLTLSTKHVGYGYKFASGRGAGEVYLFAEEYDGADGEPREAKITLVGTETVVVVKQMPSGEIQTSVPSVTFGKEEAKRTIAVEVSDNSKEWTMVAVDPVSGEQIDWVSLAIAPEGRASVSGKGSQSVEVSVLANEGEGRSACVMLGEETLFEVEQTDAAFVAVESVSMLQELTVTAGFTSNVEFEFNPATPTDDYIVFTSSAPEVATVDEYGMVTALTNGEAIITAAAGDNTNGEQKAECVVTVEGAISVESVAIEGDAAFTMEKSSTKTLVAVINPTNATIKDVSWESSDDAVVTVDDNGLITAVADGEATITVTTTEGEKTAECVVTVETSVTGIEIENDDIVAGAITIPLNGTASFTAKVSPDDATNAEYTFSLTNTEEAVSYEEVDGLFTVTGLKGGTATLTATSKDDATKKASVTITVEEIKLESIAIADISLPINKTRSVAVTLNPTKPSYSEIGYSFSPEGKIEIVDGVVSVVADSGAAVGDVITVTATSTHYTDVSTTFTVTITEAPKEYAAGDLYPDATTPVGIVFWVDPADATKGKVISLKSTSTTNASKKHWSEIIDTAVGASSTTDGKANTDLVLSQSDLATNYPAFAEFKKDFVDGNTDGVEWYIPAFVEMKQFYVVLYNRTAVDGVEDWINGNVAGAEFKGGAEKSELTGYMNAYNEKYKDVDGFVKFSGGYWCSTEGNITQLEPESSAVFLSINGQNLQAKPKNAIVQVVRPIAKFGY